MNKKVKILAIIIAIITIFATSVVYAANEDVTLVKVKDNVCEIKMGEDGKLVKKLIDVSNENKDVTLQVDVTNLKSEEENVKPSEIFLVIDNSKSMTANKLADGKTRKETVFEAAKTLASKILTNQSTSKIGVVRFSTSTEIAKEGTLEDASLVIAPTSDVTAISSAIDSIEANGDRTDIDAGLQVAKANFSTDTNLNKYVILLTDGVPNTAVGGPTMTYGGEVTTKTKSTIQSLKDSNLNLITVMTGVNSTYQPDPDGTMASDAAGKTYKDLAEDIFGTATAPNYGPFYYVTDENVTDIITNKVYENVVTIVKNEIKDIVVVDYFPADIIANYDFEIFEKENIGTVTATVNTENNSITWTIGTLEAGKTASFKYKLKLKENFDEKIINVETPTNEKVDVKYTGTDGKDNTVTSDVSPSIMLKKEEPAPTPTPEPENKIPDNTTAPDSIPQTGDSVSVVISTIIIMTIVGLGIYTVKYKKDNK